MKFASKRDLWIGILIWSVVLIPLALSIYALFTGLYLFVVFAVSLLTSAFFMWVWFGTNYEIGNECLIIRFGPIRQKILYKQIKSFKEARNPLSSAALSLERLEITYGDFGVVYISPKDKEGFISEIKSKCNNAI